MRNQLSSRAQRPPPVSPSRGRCDWWTGQALWKAGYKFSIMENGDQSALIQESTVLNISPKNKSFTVTF